MTDEELRYMQEAFKREADHAVTEECTATYTPDILAHGIINGIYRVGQVLCEIALRMK